MTTTTSGLRDDAGASEGPEDWYRLPADVVLGRLGSTPDGLSATEAARRLAEVGPNELARPDKPSAVRVALSQLRDPMNVMLIAVMAVSLVPRDPSAVVYLRVLTRPLNIEIRLHIVFWDV